MLSGLDDGQAKEERKTAAETLTDAVFLNVLDGLRAPQQKVGVGRSTIFISKKK